MKGARKTIGYGCIQSVGIDFNRGKKLLPSAGDLVTSNRC